MGEFIIGNLENALNLWNSKLTEIWELLLESPLEFKNGTIWNVIKVIYDSLQAIGFSLLVLFFVIGVVKTCTSFNEVKRIENALKLFIRFSVAKVIVTYGLDLLLAIFKIVRGIMNTIINTSNLTSAMTVALPPEVINAINKCNFFESIPLWTITLIGSLVIIVLSFVMIMTVYGRFLKLYIYTAIAPITLSTFAGSPTQHVGKNFLKSYCATCFEGVIIVLSCIIFSLFTTSTTIVDPNVAAVTQVWAYIGEIAFNMLILVTTVKLSDRIVKEVMGL